MDNAIVDVLMITYNHDEYIEQAIKSILNQKTNFHFRLIIADDYSQDDTVLIIGKYAKDCKSNLLHIDNEENIGATRNIANALTYCKSKYIAFCEGDDFWQDTNKLQKQVEFLEKNPDFGLVHSDVDHLYQNSGQLIKNFNSTMRNTIPEGNIFDDLIDSSRNHGHIIKTMSVVVRQELLDKYYNPQVAIDRDWKLTDLAMWLDIAKHTKIHYIDESLATYRLLEESASRTDDPKKKLEFHNSVFNVRKYYMDKYNCSDKLKEKLEIGHNKTLLADAYFVMERELSEEAFRYLKDHVVKLSMKEKLLYYGVKYTFVRHLIENVRKIFL